MIRRNVLRFFVGSAVSAIKLRSPSGESDENSQKALCLRKFRVPIYPQFARQTGLEGYVAATVHITSEGLVKSVEGFSGHEVFRETVEKSLQSWEFVNPSSDMQELRVKFRFALKGIRDVRCLHYEVSGQLPDSFVVEVNPAPDVFS